MNKKMENIDTDPFGEHESRPEEPTDENIPLTLVGGGSTWEPEHEQETSFEGKSLETLSIKPWKVLLKVCIKGYLEVMMNPWEQSIFIISTSEMDSYTTRTMSIP